MTHTSHVRSSAAPDEVLESVLRGLKKPEKELSPVWFYDDHGSYLFDRICELPEYYLTRTELAIMREHAPEMARHIGRGAALVELGSGTSAKTRLLLDHIDMPATYVPVDIAREYLLDAAGAIARDYPELHVIPVNADFSQPFELPIEVARASRCVVYFPGSTLGNFDRAEAASLLSRIRGMIGRHGAALIGIDLRKDAGVLRRAYNDAAGLTAAFNLNALRHLNRKLGADFDLEQFEHAAIWVEDKSRIEMHLISKRDQRVHIGHAEVTIKRGEHIRTEYSHKYTLEDFAELAESAGLRVREVWTDRNRYFSVQLLEPHTFQ
ncbi:MAG: L-histidine N(alpha)-methyltransferase [Gammaproteobacteria bacterium]|nr:L-histidine N(alpha)-methyltransferase [Gammaproteobacteria bacterium]